MPPGAVRWWRCEFSTAQFGELESKFEGCSWNKYLQGLGAHKSEEQAEEQDEAIAQVEDS